MYRRIVGQTTAAVAVLSLAGCLGGGSEPGSNDSDPNGSNGNDSTTDDPPEPESDVIDSGLVEESTLTRTGSCAEAGEATVAFGDTDPEATVSGCLTGHNGCAEPVVDGVSEADGVFEIVMGEEDRSDPGTACTEALVKRGYELHLRFVNELPSTIEVVHDDVDGRAVVATADRP